VTSVKTSCELGEEAERRQTEDVRGQARRNRLKLNDVSVSNTERVDLHLGPVLLRVPCRSRCVRPFVVVVIPAQRQQLADYTHGRRTDV